MSQFKITALVVLCAGLVGSLTACGVRTSDASSDSGANRKDEAANHLFMAQQASVQAVKQANVVPNPTPSTGSGPTCQLAVQGATPGQNLSPVFEGLKAKMLTILQDVQNADEAALDDDLKAFQAAILDSVSEYLAEVEDCIPEVVSAPVNQPPPQALNPAAGLQGFNIPQILGQMGGAH